MYFLSQKDLLVGWEVGVWPVRVAQLGTAGEHLLCFFNLCTIFDFACILSFCQPPLVTHLPTLTGGADGVRVLVPLCGKAGCLLHLYNAGHTVVGDLDHMEYCLTSKTQALRVLRPLRKSSSVRTSYLLSRATFLVSR